MMEILNEKDKCTGCGLCSAKCPKEAISMVGDKEGFLYPHINTMLCINCGSCFNACPHLSFNKDYPITIKNRIFYGFARKNKKRKQGSSGGLFYAIASHLIKKGYVVYGASFDNNFNLIHKRIEDEFLLKNLCNSKYVQSDIRNCYALIKKDIANGRNVLFVGTPCQVNAVKKYVGMTNQLITIDLICFGVGSNQIFKDFLSSKEKEYNSKAKSFNFRTKMGINDHGYTNIKFANNKKYRCVFDSTEFGWFYTRRLINRPSCYSCQYSSSVRVGDISLGDYRRAIKKINPFKYRKGISLFRVNSTNGLKIIEELAEEKEIVFMSLVFSEVESKLTRQKGEIVSTIDRNELMSFYTNNNYQSFLNAYYKKTRHSTFKHWLEFAKECVKWIFTK